MAQSTEQAGSLQGGLDVLDRALAPRVLLLSVVDGHQRLLKQRGHPRTELRLCLQHLRLRHPSLEEGQLDIGTPQFRLRVGDPAEAVRVDPEQLRDNRRADSLRELELDRRHHRQFVLADVVLRLRLGEADGLADGSQQFHGDAGSFAQLLEGRGGDIPEPIERARV
jgi:hypothetical protein